MTVVLPELRDTLLVAVPPISSLITSASFVAESTVSRERALRAIETDSSPWHDQMAALLLEKGDAQRALHHANRAIELSNQRADENALGDALRTLALVQIRLDNMDAACAAINQLDDFGYKRNPRTMARYCEARATYAHKTGSISNGQFFESESRCLSAIRAYEALGDIHGQLRSRLGIAIALGALGHYPEAIDAAETALQICIERECWRHVPPLLLIRALCIRDTGIHDPTRVLFEEAISWSDAIGAMPVLADGWLGYGMLLGYDVTPQDPSGLSAAESAFDRGLALARQIDSRNMVLDNHKWRAVLYEKLGMESEARALRTIIAGATDKTRGDQGTTTLDRIDQERKQLENWRHQRFRIRMRETIESMPDALFVLDAVHGTSGRIVDLINEFRNDAGHELSSCARSDVLTLTQLERLPEFDGLRERITTAIEKRHTYLDEIWIEGSPGRCIARRVVPVGDGVAVSFRDATVEREAKAALSDAADRAREADRAKSEFLANMSHEVRTPINGVLGLARLLEDTPLDESQQSYVTGIISSADILLTVIGDVLDLSKIEAGRVEIVAEPTEVRPLVHRVCSLFQGQAKSKGLVLTSEVANDLPPFILVDSSRLQQVLANLVGNAVKFTTTGSVQLRAQRAGSSIRFEVQDTGPGIAQSAIDSAFEAFQQATREAMLQGGTGLGLTIARSVVELMGGRIGVDSQLGEGSCFWVEVPLFLAHAPAVEKVDRTRADVQNMRVLLVEDNAVNVMVAVGVLRKAGCEVDVASDGERAVAMVREHPYDAVLMDVRMPGMDGLEATRRIRAAESDRRIPIIALTASALTGDREECFQAGMDDYLGKPFAAQTLKETLAKWVRA